MKITENRITTKSIRETYKALYAGVNSDVFNLMMDKFDEIDARLDEIEAKLKVLDVSIIK